MKISKLFAAAGKHGTVAVEGTFAGICGLGILFFRKYVIVPVKEDTRAELVEQGYSLEEIKESEGKAINCLKEATISLFGLRDGELLHGPKNSEPFDVPQNDIQPEASTT